MHFGKQAQRERVTQLRLALRILDEQGFKGTADDLRTLLQREELRLLDLELAEVA